MSAGEEVFRVGQPAEALYVCQRGGLAWRDLGGRNRGSVGAGEVVGEEGLIAAKGEVRWPRSLVGGDEGASLLVLSRAKLVATLGAELRDAALHALTRRVVRSIKLFEARAAAERASRWSCAKTRTVAAVRPSLISNAATLIAAAAPANVALSRP